MPGVRTYNVVQKMGENVQTAYYGASMDYLYICKPVFKVNPAGLWGRAIAAL